MIVVVYSVEKYTQLCNLSN